MQGLAGQKASMQIVPSAGANEVAGSETAFESETAFGSLRQDVRSRIPHLVDAVAESHQLLTGFDLPAQEGLGPRRVGDLEDHVERGSGRTAVQRSLQRANGADDRRDQIRPG